MPSRGWSPFECATSVSISFESDKVALAGDDFRSGKDLADAVLATFEESAATQGVELRSDGPELHVQLFRVEGAKEFGLQFSADSWEEQWAVESEQTDGTPTLEDLRRTIAFAFRDSFTLGLADGPCAPVRYASANSTAFLELAPRNPDAAKRYLLAKGLDVSEKDFQRQGFLFTVDRQSGEEIEVAPLDLELDRFPQKVLVADDASFVVVLERRPSNGPAEDFILILRGDGKRVNRLEKADILTPSDLRFSPRSTCGWSPPYEASLRIGDGPPILALDLSFSSSETHSRVVEVDLESGTLATEKRDLLPHFRALPAIAAISAPSPFGSFVCEAGVEATDLLTPRDRIEVAPARLYARSLRRPLPIYPEICQKARLQMKVEAEVLVDKQGEVVCARPTNGPMGLSKAVTDAALGWKFAPLERSGKWVPMSGRIGFDFRLVDPLAEEL